MTHLSQLFLQQKRNNMYEICNGFTSDPDCAINDVIKSNLVMQIFSLVYSHTLLKKFGHIIMIIAE